MAEQKLLVKREGDFHYPIYLKNDCLSQYRFSGFQVLLL